jgi:hypothetical protein
MKVLLLILLAAPVVMGGMDVCAKAEMFKAKCAQPICKCDAIKACKNEAVAKMEKKMKECMASCQTSNPIPGVDFDKLGQCHADKKAAMMKAKECFEAELPKPCDEGSGVTELPLPELPAGGKHRKRKGGMKKDPKKMVMKLMSKMIPKEAQGYFKCVMKCGKKGGHGHGSSEEGHGHRRVKRGGHFKFMKCADQLGCRFARTFTHEKMKEVHEKCLPKPQDMAAGLMKTCECGKAAGVNVDCAAVAAKVAEMVKKMTDVKVSGGVDVSGSVGVDVGGRKKRDIILPHPDPNVVCFYKRDKMKAPHETEPIEEEECDPMDFLCQENFKIPEEFALLGEE